MVTPRVLSCWIQPSPRPMSSISHPCCFRYLHTLYRFIFPVLSLKLHCLDFLPCVKGIRPTADGVWQTIDTNLEFIILTFNSSTVLDKIWFDFILARIPLQTGSWV